VIGAASFILLLVLALFGERIAPHEAIYFVPEHGSDPRPYDPGLVFPLGSDILGRDIFSLVLAGARTTLTIVLVGGCARVMAGAVIAAVSSWWRPARVGIESIAELVSAVPATLVALLLVKILVRTDTSILVFIGALLVTGWAGPYRVVRAEVDRLDRMSFSQGAIALGVGRWRLFWRHHLPHLVPTLAMNLSQQIVATLVLVAELGVLGVFVGATRLISIEESLSRVIVGQTNATLIADPPEWGGLLANARTLESLWTTRWLILVPGVGFAITAVAVASIGFALAHRYARRDVMDDLRGLGAGGLAVITAALFVVSALVPDRYAAAAEWASAARGQLRPTADPVSVFTQAGLRPLAATYAVERQTALIAQTAAASATVGTVTVSETWPRPTTSAGATRQVRSFVTGGTGGGVVEAPLVFAGRGVVPSDHPPQPATPAILTGRPDIGRFLKDYPDDYAQIDVRGKVVLLARFLGVATRGRNALQNDYAFGPSVDESIADAIKRGAAAVLFVDPALPLYTDTVQSGTARDFNEGIVGGVNPYLRLERDAPPSNTSGVPVVILGKESANTLLAPLGLDLTPFLRFDEVGDGVVNHASSRDLAVRARVEVPLARQSALVTSYLGEVDGVPTEAGRVLVWAVRRPGEPAPAGDVVASLARALAPHHAPFIFVVFDPSVDAKANAQILGDLLSARRITLVLVLDQLQGSALRFTTPYGDLIPALDLYADKAMARHEVTRTTPPIGALSGIAPLISVKTVLVSGNGAAGDLRPDATAVVAYLAGRLALGAEELPR
jgi:peptide/nickel transport system permease protein